MSFSQDMDDDPHIQETESKDRSRKQQIINEAKELLAKEGFDAVVLMATYTNESGSTTTLNGNGGNWHAQTGMLLYAVKRREESARIEQRQEEQDSSD